MNELDLDLGFTEEEAPRPRSRRHARRRRERRRRRKGRAAAAIAFFVIVGVLGGLVWGGYTVVQAVTDVPDYTGAGSGMVTFQVESGQSTRSIATDLEKAGVVKSAKAFRKAAEDDPASMNIQPGHYKLNKHMAAALALDKLLDPAAKIQWRVTVPEGLRASKVLALLAKKTEMPVSKFQAAAKDASTLGLPASAKGKVEGYLFPATYEFPPGSTPSTILQAMVERYLQEEANLQLATRAKAVGLTPHEALTLASMLEAEVKTKDFTKVSRVVFNRLHKGMRIQFDSTVLYALNKSTYHVTHDDLDVNSPYNTYRNDGLPPGPVGNPGSAAIKAALSPATGPWLYFVTTNLETGETKFTDDPAEFKRFKEEFKRNRDGG
ncbi:MAG: endolytic transglycosylase MltG [Streptosporangiales bacterium]|nr:endolytic transglycosylase MltG [Streptosporangiales bacterium]